MHILWCKWNCYMDIWRNIERAWKCRVYSVVSRPLHAIFNIKNCSARSPYRTAQLGINKLKELHAYKLNSHIRIRGVKREICSRNFVLQFSWLLSKIKWKLRSVLVVWMCIHSLFIIKTASSIRIISGCDWNLNEKNHKPSYPPELIPVNFCICVFWLFPPSECTQIRNASVVEIYM